MKDFWDQRYADKEYVYGRTPNIFLKNYIDIGSPGKILFPGDGEGRNSVYAAQKGWKVTAVDISERGKEKATIWASQNKTELDYQIADLSAWESNEKFDCIALIYCHFHSLQRQVIHHKFSDLLASGGIILMEAFSKKQLNYDSGGPRDLDFLYDEKLLKEDFNHLQIEFLQERVIDLDEGRFHRGEAGIIRLIARKLGNNGKV